MPTWSVQRFLISPHHFFQGKTTDGLMPLKKHALQEHLKETLRPYRETTVCWIAYSGGVDSHVLLHALASIRDTITPRICAVHVNHGLHKDADLWEARCREVCESYAIPLRSFAVAVSDKNGANVEALAREKRYTLLAGLMGADDLVLTAHHANDQIETLLLNLMRGSGVDGLAAMPRCRVFAKGFLLRPLLHYDRSEIEQYAQDASLQWIEDESNQLDRQDRNYLRNRVLPMLVARWPGVLNTLQRAIAHQADVKCLIDEIARDDLLVVCGDKPSRIVMAALAGLPGLRRKNVLRAWIKKNALAVPHARTLEILDRQALAAHRSGAHALHVAWKGAEARGYRGELYLMPPLPAHDARATIVWPMDRKIALAGGCLSALPTVGDGIKKCLIVGERVKIAYRQGGEKIGLPGRCHRHRLKKLFQAAGLPPWQRDRIPLIFHGGRLIAVADLWIDRQYVASPSEPALKIRWERN